MEKFSLLMQRQRCTCTWTVRGLQPPFVEIGRLASWSPALFVGISHTQEGLGIGALDLYEKQRHLESWVVLVPGYLLLISIALLYHVYLVQYWVSVVLFSNVYPNGGGRSNAARNGRAFSECFPGDSCIR